MEILTGLLTVILLAGIIILPVVLFVLLCMWVISGLFG